MSNQFVNGFSVKNSRMFDNVTVNGNLTVSGAILPTTFTDRVSSFTDLGATGTLANLTANQSGTVFLIPTLTGNQTVFLPPASIGTTFVFIATDTIGGTCIIQAVGTDKVNGKFASAANTFGAADGAQSITFNTAATPGDRLDITCVGSGSGAWMFETNGSNVVSGSFS